MSATGHIRGNPVTYDTARGEWIDDQGRTGERLSRARCAKCLQPPTPEGYDACLGYIPGVTSACCGHGRDEDALLVLAPAGRDEGSES